MTDDWKQRLGVVFSTDPDYRYDTGECATVQTLPPERQDLRVWRDSRQRAGKVVTAVRGFVGCDEDLQELGRELKRKLGVGGSVKDGEILIQGDHRDRTVGFLTALGYRCKKV